MRRCSRCTLLATRLLRCALSASQVWPCVMQVHFVLFLAPAGVREKAMGWTMTARDDFRVIAWTRRAGNPLSLLLLLTLLSLSVQWDIALPRERRFSWRTGTSNLLNFTYDITYVNSFFFTCMCEDLTKGTTLKLCSNTHKHTHTHTHRYTTDCKPSPQFPAPHYSRRTLHNCIYCFVFFLFSLLGTSYPPPF